MIKTTTCHWVVCDGCGREDLDVDYTRHYDTEAEAVEGLTENDGYVDPVTKQQLCWHCRDLPHAVRTPHVCKYAEPGGATHGVCHLPGIHGGRIANPDACARCGEPAADHPDTDPEPTT